MRVIVYGIGAIGGVIAARLALSGFPVAGIARGRQLEAVRSKGLTLRSPGGTAIAQFPVYEDPTEIAFTPADVIVLATKSQDSAAALERLNLANATALPIVCCQNGVANERLALRFFRTVIAVRVGMPADYSVPGEVVAFGASSIGTLDLGRYPTGPSPVAETLSHILQQAGFDARAHADIMPYKYQKLLGNLRNIVDALFADPQVQQHWYDQVLAEGLAVLAAAGIAIAPPDTGAPAALGAVPGVARIGSSSLQSIVRAAGSVETDYLNGEIALLGRLHGVPTPVNVALCGFSKRLVSGAVLPGGLSETELRTELDRASQYEASPDEKQR